MKLRAELLDTAKERLRMGYLDEAERYFVLQTLLAFSDFLDEFVAYLDSRERRGI